MLQMLGGVETAPRPQGQSQQRSVALKKAEHVLILHSNTSPQMQQRLGAVLTSHHRTSTPSTISGQRSLQFTGKLFSGLALEDPYKQKSNTF